METTPFLLWEITTADAGFSTTLCSKAETVSKSVITHCGRLPNTANGYYNIRNFMKDIPIVQQTFLSRFVWSPQQEKPLATLFGRGE